MLRKYKISGVELIKRSFYGFMCFVIAFQQVYPAYAQITPDASAAAQNQANVINAPNGVPLVNIINPNGSGVSHNQFTDYNVGAEGVILNNSRNVGTSQLGGVLLSNPNLGAEASTIINEVTSSNPSVLEGFTEVFGRSADVLVANPNGITCRGCGFINTPQSTLATGTPGLDGTGALSNISIDGGTIRIEGDGLNALDGNNKAQLLSRAIEVNADIQAGELEVITGRNDYDPATGAVNAKADNGSVKPTFAIDSSALGGMYAGRITLRGTEDGVGFRLNGDLGASASDLVLTNSGRIELKNAAAQNNLSITSTGVHDIEIDEALTSENDLEISSSNDVNLSENATIEGKGDDTQLTALNAISNNGGAVVGHGNLNINATNLVNRSAIFIAGNDLNIQGVADGTNITVLDNLAGSLEAINGDINIFADTLNNIGEAETTTVSRDFYYRFRRSTVPGFIPNGPDISDGGYRQLYDGNNTYTIAAHPDEIEAILAENGRTLDEFYDETNDRYVFEVADWLSIAPNSRSSWNEQLGRWALYSPDEDQNAPSNGYIIASSVRDELVPGSLRSAGISTQRGNVNLVIDTDLVNDKSYISAANDLNITGTGHLTDRSEFLERRITQGTSYRNHTTLRETGWGAWLEGISSRLISNEIIDTLPSTFAAGGNNTITLTGDVVSVSSPVTALNEFDFGLVSSGIVRNELVTGNTPGSLFLNSGLIRPSSDANFKFETRFSFTDLSEFFGSEFFLRAILGDAFDPDNLMRRLGDAYIENKVITQQILAETGRKFLSDGFASDTDQVKALLDSGIATQGNLNLTPLVALTPEQQLALTQDIVWYEERIVDGEALIVPQLYLAQATFDDLGTKLRGSTFSGQNVNITAQNVSFDLARASASNDLNISAIEDITSISSVFDGNDVTLNAGNDFTLATGARATGNGVTEVGVVKDLVGEIEARNNAIITAGGNGSIIGSIVNAGNNIDVRARNIVVSSQELTSFSDRSLVDDAQLTSRQTVQDESVLNAGNGIALNAVENAIVRGSDLSAEENIIVEAALGNVVIESAEETGFSNYESDTTTATSESTNNQASTLTTQNGDITIRSGLGDVTLRTAEIDSGNDINLDAANGEVQILASVDREYDRKINTKSNAVWQSFEDKGSEHETVRHTLLTGEGDLNITAANGVTVQYRETGDLASDIEQLSQAPGLAFLADLQNDPNVDFDGIREVHREWADKQEGLSGPAAAVIAIAIAVATQQYALASKLVAAGVSTTTATAASGAFSALASQAGISLINNQGNLGAVFNELASASTVRSVAAAALTAGLVKYAGGDLLPLGQADGLATQSVLQSVQEQLITAGVSTEVDTVVTGVDFSDSLKNNLRFAGAAVLGAQLSQEIGIEFAKNELDPTTGINRGTQLIAHAALGCAAGAVGTGNCGAGAASQLAGEISSIIHGEITIENVEDVTQDFAVQNVDIARLSGALAAALAGGDAADVNLGANLGGTAAENNNLLTILAAATAADARGCSKIKSCAVKAGQQAAKVAARLGKSTPKNVDDVVKSAARPSRAGSQDTRVLQALKKRLDQNDTAFRGLDKNTDTANKLIRDILKSENRVVRDKISNGDKIRDIFDPVTKRGVRLRNNEFDTFVNF